MGKIVSSTFPRCGSRFARSIFESLYGPENYVEGLCKLNYLNYDNAFTIIRNPKDAIESWVSAVENYFEGFAGFTVENVVEESIKLYIEWIEKTISRIPNIYVTTFERFTEDTQNELDKISKHFNLQTVKYNKDEIFVDYKHIPGGNPRTELSNTVQLHPDFYKATELYDQVIKLIK